MYTSPPRIDGKPIREGISNISYLGKRYLRERGGDFTDTTLSAKLGATATNTLLLLPDTMSGISFDDVDNNDFDISLTAIPELGRGRQNSRTMVQFGQLHISSDHSRPAAELVATKFLHPLTAPREFHAARTVNKRFGENVAFSPMGFIRSPNSKIGYISRYDHGVITLDNTLWNDSSSEQQREEAMGFAGLWLATLHNYDIIHGDAQAKNIARDSSNQVRYVDLEGAHDINYGRLDSQTTRLLDISNLFDPHYMPPTSPDEEAIFIDSYTEHQSNRKNRLDGNDIMDTIRNAQEQS